MAVKLKNAAVLELLLTNLATDLLLAIEVKDKVSSRLWTGEAPEHVT